MKSTPLTTKIVVLVLSCSTLACAISTRVPHPIQPPLPIYPPQVPVGIEPTAIPAQDVEIAPIAVFPLPGIPPAAPVPPGIVPVDHQVINTTTFTTTLHSGRVEKFVLGPCSVDGGYLVDISPLEASTDGAHIEQQVLPEFDGEMWVDVLTVLLPSDVPPLKVHVQVYSTAGWPVVFQSTLNLNPGAWHGFRVQESSVAGGYVIEINPRGTAQPGDRVERALVQPEFPADGYWCDVLRLMIPVEQLAMEAEVIVYQTPAGLPVVAEYELDAEAGVWYGLGIGDSQAGGAYVVEVTPLVNELSQIERYTIQPEFDGQNWNDVVRVMVSPEWPTMPLRVTVYLAGGG